jgi:adenylate cyclase
MESNLDILCLHILLGTDEGKFFDLKYNKIYTVGRSPDNDIQIEDKNISRYHLKIQCKENKYFITDLNSKNGTFVSGEDISPGFEVEVEEGVPVVVGMSIIGLGKGRKIWLKSFLDGVGICSEPDENGEILKSYGVKAIKKKVGFIYDMNNILMESKDINEISEKMLECIFNFFKGADRCVIILIDAETEEISNVIYRSKNPLDDHAKVYNHELVEQALILNKAVMVSDSYAEDAENNEFTKSLQLNQIRSAICVPMNSPLQKRGAIYIDSLGISNGFRKNDIDLLQDISSRMALTMDHL